MSHHQHLLSRIFFLLAFLVPVFCSAQATFVAGDINIILSSKGEVTGFRDRVKGTEYLDASQPAPLLQVRVKGRWEGTSSALFSADPRDHSRGLLTLSFAGSGLEINIRVLQASGYTRFEVIQVNPAGVADAVAWGPYPLSLSETVSEIAGVARNSDLAIGLQVLNVKTLGGFPLNDEGSDPSRGSTAKRTATGCVLQAFSLDRSRPRQISVWWDQFPGMVVPPIEGETTEGSAIALFGCKAGQALATIGAIEVAENLPHPVFDGTWGKLSDRPGQSYLIADYSESTIGELLSFANRGGFRMLYHMNAWKSWGHYEPDSAFFPHGLEGFGNCLARAKAMKIGLGAHTLTDFINTNDPYVTPVPDPRLAVTGSSKLTTGAGESDTTLSVASPDYFNNEKANWLHTVRIGNELIRYRAVSAKAPWKLLGCQRGAFGTRPFTHRQGEAVDKLMDHPYKVFLPNLDLMKEIASNLAHRYNQTGLGQMDFDGHEGCLSTGQGDYAIELFAKIFYDSLDHPVLNGSSNSEPFYWHINSYCNWGEPWTGGFTESMQQYRLDNQALLERNWLPNMLGWYLLTDSTTLAEMEWMLARAAGYNAGFAMATSLADLKKNPHAGRLLDAIHDWEACRHGGAFSAELREQMRDPKKEFHMEKVSKNTWDLYPVTRDPKNPKDIVAQKFGKPVKIVMPKKK